MLVSRAFQQHWKILFLAADRTAPEQGEAGSSGHSLTVVDQVLGTCFGNTKPHQNGGTQEQPILLGGMAAKEFQCLRLSQSTHSFPEAL